MSHNVDQHYYHGKDVKWTTQCSCLLVLVLLLLLLHLKSLHTK